MTHTPTEWRMEAVSDCVRIVTGAGRQKIILARLAPKQISENETAANAQLMCAAPKLVEACKKALTCGLNSDVRELVVAALELAKQKPRASCERNDSQAGRKEGR